ncbi:fibronectin type III domain-containing protein [Desertimonas flava]|uniref:fibronectin type III domain-containing protein n=1 Tax=Desertimonas flava TaxID=2064846 RepID=UPI000E35477E|nr:fibronectin type III domain-containing protein [Desertimonas flava]
MATVEPIGTPSNWSGTEVGMTPNAARLDDTHWVVAYQVVGSDGFAVIHHIDAAGTITQVGTPFEFDPIGAAESRPYVAVGATPYQPVVFYRSVDNDGFAQVLTVNDSTWDITSTGPALEYDPAFTSSQDVEVVTGDIFLVVYRGDANDGWASTIQVTAGVPSTLHSFEFDTTNGMGPAVSKINDDDTKYLVTYDGANNDGFAKVLNVDASTYQISELSVLEFDTTEGRQNSLQRLDANHFLAVWTNATTGATFGQVLEVDLATWAITAIGTPTSLPASAFTLSAERPQTMTLMSEVAGVYSVVRARRDAASDIFVDVITVDSTTWAVTTDPGSQVAVFTGGVDPYIKKISDTRFVVWWQSEPGDLGYAQTFDFVPDPPPLAAFSDDFAGDGPLAPHWILVNGSGVTRVNSQAVTTTGNGRDQLVWAGDCVTLNQYSQVDMDCDNGETTSCTLRSNGVFEFPWLDGYMLYYWPAYTTLWLRKNTGGGAGSDLTSAVIGDLTGIHRFRLEARDLDGTATELRAYVDDLDTPVITYTDPSEPLTGTKVGFGWGFFSDSAMRGIADNFEAGDLPPEPDPPAQVTGLVATPGDAEVELAWTTPADGGSPITDYVVERAPDVAGAPGAWSTLADGTSTATTYLDTDVVNGSTYWYRVSAINEVGTGPASTAVSATPGAPPAPAYDSFLTVDDVGPIHVSAGGDGQHIQWWNATHRRGFAFTPTVDVHLHGVRTWHVGPAAPAETITETIYVGPIDGGAAAVATLAGYSGPFPSPGWSTYLFDEPVALTAGVPRCIWISAEASANFDLARWAAYFVDQQPSRLGLLEATQPTSHYNGDTAGSTVPFATTDAWYWIDPLVTAAAPAGVTMTGVSGTFAPWIGLVAGSTATVEWRDSSDALLATGITPSITAPVDGVVVMRVLDGGAQAIGDVEFINLGYDNTQDSGRDNLPATFNWAPQSLTGITGLTHCTGLKHFFAAQSGLTGHLDVSGLAALTHVECYQAEVTSIDFTGCDSMIRLCMEQNDLSGTIDLTPLAGTLQDLRCANQQSGAATIGFVSDTPMLALWHYCVRVQNVTQHLPMSQLPVVEQWWVWDTGITTYDAPISPLLRSVLAHSNPIDSATASLYLETLNTLGASNGNLRMDDAAAPAAATDDDRAALIARGWSVTMPASVPDPEPQTWDIDPAVIEVTAVDDAWTTAVTWTGDAAGVAVAVADGAWVTLAAFTTEPIIVTVTVDDGVWTAGPTTWSGDPAAVVVTADDGAWVSGEAAWTAEPVTVVVAAEDGVWTAGATTWHVDAAAVTVTVDDGPWATGAEPQTWIIDPVLVEAAPDDGVWTPGAATWGGEPTVVVVTVRDAAWVFGSEPTICGPLMIQTLDPDYVIATLEGGCQCQ